MKIYAGTPSRQQRKLSKLSASIKALHFQRHIPLVRLMDLLEGTGLDIPSEIKEADVLTRYAVETRYPGFEEEVTEAEYQVALRLAPHVVEWAEKVTKGEGTQVWA